MPILVTEDQGPVRVLRLNRPEVRNALNPGLQRALYEALDEAEAARGVRSLVLTGTGKAFCSGLDLGDLRAIAERPTEANRADSEYFADLLERLYTFPKPVVAALNGHAVAGGAGLASVCDLVVMSQAAKLGYTEARIGFVAALVGIFLVRQVGEKHARDLLLSARLVEAEEALAMGLVNELRPADEVLKRALERATALSKNAPSSLAMTKTLLAAAPGMGLSEGLRYATDLNALARTTDDLKEGVSAFLDKREPNWKDLKA